MSEKRPKIYAIDFDGTICENKWPGIGEPIKDTVNYIFDIQERGDQWILYTMRDGAKLDEALSWLAARGLRPNAVNDNLPQMKAFYGNNPRKVFANVYIDDHNAGGLFLQPFPTDDDKAYEESGYGKRMEKLNMAARILSDLSVELHKDGEQLLSGYVDNFIEGIGYASLDVSKLVHPEHYQEDINDL